MLMDSILELSVVFLSLSFFFLSNTRTHLKSVANFEKIFLLKWLNILRRFTSEINSKKK